ncbi:hypothetical protein [Lactococcus garvieae]|uniref:hypothetical protein n=1 Tax=Lactococcus garvieae TaxID=1363 RepID=UPI0022E48726|nr:hypothetical protein [Lactococcus garvieae]
MIKIPEQAESPHFPKDYEYQFLGQKQQIAKKLHKEAEFTALSLAKNAYQMYDYLESLGANNPNGLLIAALDYASEVLGVPPSLIQESFWTQHTLKEEEIYEASLTYNPENETKKKEEALSIAHKKIEELFSSLLEEAQGDVEFLELLKQKNSKNTSLLIICYELFAQKAWQKLKSDFKDLPEAEAAYYLYFYEENKTDYSKHVKENIHDFYEKNVKLYFQKEEKSDPELIGLLEDASYDGIHSYIEKKLPHFLEKSQYQKFLKDWSHNLSLSFQNLILLKSQKEELGNIKTIPSWLNQGETIPKGVPLLFVLDEENQSHLLPVVSDQTFIKRNATKDDSGLNLKALFLSLSKLTQAEIVFEEGLPTPSEWRSNKNLLCLNPDFPTEQVIFELAKRVFFEDVAATSQEKFIQESSIYLVFASVDLPCPSDTFEYVQQFKNESSGHTHFQSVITQIQRLGLKFIEKMKTVLYEKEEEKLFLSLEEEIEQAKSLEKLAIENVSTSKENEQTTQDSPQEMSMDELIFKAQQSTGNGENDDTE